jgi:nucleotide-binding universal stress UspA family protein
MAEVFTRPLLATERTEFDTGAERLALAMARRCGHALALVLPLTSNPEFEAVAPELALRAERDAAAKLARLRSQAQAAGVELELQVRRGAEPWREIVDAARERSADLLVIRRRGRRSFLAELLVGEMVSDVLAHAPCHVLVVPRDAQMWSRRVLVAVEPDAQGRRLMALAVAVAVECGVPITAVCVVGSAAAEERRSAQVFVTGLCEVARRKGASADAEVLDGAPVAAQVLDATRRVGADLIVMGVRGFAHEARQTLGRVAREVTGRADCAVLLALPQGASGEGLS